MSNGSSYPPKRVWRLWKVSPPQITTEQAVGYTLQNVVTLEERVAQHSLNFLQMARKGKLPWRLFWGKNRLQKMVPKFTISACKNVS